MLPPFPLRCGYCSGGFGAKQTIVGLRLKYHSHCFNAGRACPDPNDKSSTGGAGNCHIKLSPKRAARYIPERLVLKLRVNGSAMTLFYGCDDKNGAMKGVTEQDATVKLCFTHVTARGSTKRTFAAPTAGKDKDTGKGEDEGEAEGEAKEHIIDVEVIGGNDISAVPPALIGPVVIKVADKNNDGPGSGSTNNTAVEACLGYAKFGLQHRIHLSLPCDMQQRTLAVDDSAVTVTVVDGDGDTA